MPDALPLPVPAPGRPLPALTVAALLAVALPTLFAFNLPPSATFLNQGAALVGWGLFLALLSSGQSLGAAVWRGGLVPVLLALGLLVVAAIDSEVFNGLPHSLAWGPIGMIAAAALTATVGAAVGRSGRGEDAFSAFCIALLVGGLAGGAIGVVQVFFPDWADGQWISGTAHEGRAAGNLRQPNHLSSLMLWGCTAIPWLVSARRLRRGTAALLMALSVFGVMLTSSRTGTVGIVMLFGWGLFEAGLPLLTRLAARWHGRVAALPGTLTAARPALSPASQWMLLATPVAYALFWAALALWSHHSHEVFVGEARFSGAGDVSASRFKIWSDTLALIASHPWLGVGFGEFNFAWSLTPFPHRPVAFFDHTHNLPLQFAVELGLPLAALLLLLLGAGLWRAFAAGLLAEGRRAAMLRCAFMMVLTITVHSQFEYPLWYAYFLLPAAFAFGIGVSGRRAAGDPLEPADDAPVAASGDPRRLPRPWLAIASAGLLAGGLLSLLDYSRVVGIFAAPDDAPPLSQRIEAGRHSWFFAHHAAYAEVTTTERPSDAMPAFATATHYLLDTRLMMAWARAYAETGDIERARHLAMRLREFRNADAKPFFEPCDTPHAADAPLPFQCSPPTRVFDERDFR